MNTFPRNEVLECCALYGPQLKVPAGLDSVRVMAAIASNESSLGADCGPRHEPAYEAGGAVWARKAMAPLLAQYPPAAGDPPQSPAAMSYGPWQMMFLNFADSTPEQLLTDLDACARNFVRFFNSFVVGNHVSSLAEIGEVWNEGHIAPDPAYVAKLQAAYDASPVHL